MATVISLILVNANITAMKVINSNHITPFGGLNFVLEELQNQSIDKVLSNNLPNLPSQTTYNWKDIFYSFWSIFFCGGDCIEDLSGNFKSGLSPIPYMNVPSPDRVLDRMQELSVPSQTFVSPRGVSTHEFCINNSLNRLNLRLLKRLGVFKSRKHILDYDNTLIFNNKSSARMSYKKEKAYCPGVGLVGSNIVYVENRNGNSSAKDLQAETLQRMFSLLKEENIEIDIFRADSASYDLDTLDVICQNCKDLFVKARMSETLASAIAKVSKWEKADNINEAIYFGETVFTPFKNIAKRRKLQSKIQSYRLVIKKTKRDDGQIDLFTGEAYNYSAIVTLDEEKSMLEVFDFYNQRGKAEKEFDILKNDFGWRKLPFSKLESNNVFLIIAAMCRNIYNYIINRFSSRFLNLKPSYRMKKFIFRFISLPAKWIKSGRSNILRLYGSIGFRS